MPSPAVKFQGNLAVIDFGPPFDAESYGLFLKVKALPESHTIFLEESFVHRVTTPARFANLLGVDAAPLRLRDHLVFPSHGWDYQRYGLAEAIEAKRWAAWWDCGMGKTWLEWAFAFMVAEQLTGGRVLILTLPEVIPELLAMMASWYGDTPPCPVRTIGTRAELVRWCRGDFGDGPEVGICNYEKLIPGPVVEFRHLAGIVADESSLLKAGGGTIKWNLIKSARGVEYKLSCTGTPAPNEAMEYASQGSFLERLRTEGEILWTFFSKTRDGEWYIKPHAREAFYRFLSTWSMYLRDPSAYGFRDNVVKLPEPIYLPHQVPATGEQLRMAESLGVVQAGDLFAEPKSMGVEERAKLAQAARGFVYQGGGREAWSPVDSLKPQLMADLVRCEAGAGAQVITWCEFHAEVEILRGMVSGSGVDAGYISGDTPKKRRREIVREFQQGNLQVLVSKDTLIGYGLNLPMATAHVGSPTDSAERFYQRTRRSYRYGQRERLRVHLPYVPELEGATYQNLTEKLGRMESDAVEQEHYYAAQMRERMAA
ncbi:MAG TPA: helicase-related protein [Longimicrobium sp.]|nr:helicase-related protein [Longimicrobium sp.]